MQSLYKVTHENSHSFSFLIDLHIDLQKCVNFLSSTIISPLQDGLYRQEPVNKALTAIIDKSCVCLEHTILVCKHYQTPLHSVILNSYWSAIEAIEKYYKIVS